MATYTASATNSTNCGTLSWTLEGTDSGDFQLSGSGSSRSLRFSSSPNYESPADANTNNVYSVTVKVTASSGGQPSKTRSVTVTVTNVNEAPTISGSSSRSVAENSSSVASYTASDPEGNSISWSLSGTDAGDFSISPHGHLAFASAPNYESPADANTNNLYVVTVRATDNGSPARTATKGVWVTVTNVNERPTISGSSSRSVAENSSSVASYSASDPEGNSISWSLSGTDAGDFSISSSGALSFSSAPNYESPADANTNNLYVVTVRATDNGSPARTTTKGVWVTVTNVNEAGSVSLSSSSPKVGTALTATLSDPDGGVSNTSWQWQASNSSPASWVNRGTGSSYTPAFWDVGYVLRARAGYTDAHGSGKSALSGTTGAVQSSSNPPSKPVALADTPDSVLAVVSAPNPFNPSTTLHMQLPEAGPVSLIVYNMAGQVVATLLHDHYLEAGLHARVWEGRDDHGRDAASGLYLYRLTTQGGVLLGKLALIR